MRIETVTALLGLCCIACTASAPPRATAPTPSASYMERRAVHQTRLDPLGPIMEPAPSSDPPQGVEKVMYPSGNLQLFAWRILPPEADAVGARGVPALVYLHGGFALRQDSVKAVQPFVDAGFAVMLPSLRGRNGNPGHHELIYGEVDDAAAAVRWMSRQPGIDRERIYVFGHSMGGATVAMLSLYTDVPSVLTASCGAIYSTDTFKRWSRGADRNLVRFDVEDRDEAQLRVLLPHADQLVLPHVAYMGKQERITQRNARRVLERATAAGKDFEMVVVPGDHMSALQPALARFLARAQRPQ